ncbi:MAG: metallophosphoesterase [candidate division WOR-3 bacterium]
MLIGIFSDTHDNINRIKEAVRILKEKEIKNLIHLGDYCSPFSIPLLEIEKIYAIFGNNDGDKLMLQKRANECGFQIVQGPTNLIIEGKNIAIMHEPYQLEALRKSNSYDVILYGHTHEVTIKENPLTINPGELCGYLSGRSTFVILDLSSLKYEIIEI